MDPFICFVVLIAIYGVLFFFDRFFKVRICKFLMQRIFDENGFL